MLAFRICEARYAETAFTGAGARRYEGRWHLPGLPIVYCSESRALAVLEQLVQAKRNRTPPKMVRLSVELPKDIAVKKIGREHLPADWRRGPSEGYPPELQHLGTEWLRAMESVALRVPSVIVPEEHNVLLNPRHPDFRALKTSAPEPFAFDHRLV